MSITICLGVVIGQIGILPGEGFVPEGLTNFPVETDYPETVNLLGYDFISRKRVDFLIARFRVENPTAKFAASWSFLEGNMTLFVSKRWAQVIRNLILRDPDLELKSNFWVIRHGPYFSQNSTGVVASGSGLKNFSYMGFPLLDMCPLPVSSRLKKEDIGSILAERRPSPTGTKEESKDPHLDVFYIFRRGKETSYYRVQFKGRTPIMQSWSRGLPRPHVRRT